MTSHDLPRPFRSVLVANRGEIACRIIRTLRELGIRSIAVYSDADADARHVALADLALRIGPASASESYLSVAAIVDAARRGGAEAIHPGYGFLSENAELAAACAEAGIVFVGPSPRALEVMGDKIRAKAHVAERGVPIIPGAGEAGTSDAELVAAAERVGFPLIIKPSAGGGGKGMTVVHGADALPDALAGARRVAFKAFGDDTLLLERFIAAPRHIEVQVLADAHGTTVHLGERECSLQRRHQKIIEEAPSPLLDEATRAAIGEAACEVARSVDYAGAGTVEFLVSDARPDEFFFMEMNTRLQVEHPVTELVTGIDLVEQQLRIAAGQTLSLPPLALDGHAIEARLYAEDPAAGFLPSTGTVRGLLEAAGPGVRVDSALVEGLVVGADYDPMLAKVIAHGPDRATALARLDAALADTRVLGLRTNRAYLRQVLADPDVQAGRLETSLIERIVPAAASLDPASSATDAAAVVAAALLEHARRLELATASASAGAATAARAASPLWRSPSGFRLGVHQPARYEVVDAAASPDTEPAVVLVTGSTTDATVRLSGAGPQPARLAERDGVATVHLDGAAQTFAVTRDGDVLWLQPTDAEAGAAIALRVLDRTARAAAHADRRRANGSGIATGAASPELRATMPGAVVALGAADGDRVEAGRSIVTVEAMKMEHVVLAPHSGVLRLDVAVGAQVRQGQVLARIEPEPAIADDPPTTAAGDPGATTASAPHEGAPA